MSAGQNVGPLDREARRLFQPPLPPDEATWALAAAAGISTVGLRPSFVIPAAAHSHPDCRAVLILIVAPQKYRMLNLIDEFTHECLAIRVDRKLKSADVIDVLSDQFILRGVPEHIRSDNGPEFVAKAVQDWIGALGAKTAYIERGSPWENGFVESFNARLRDELLDGEIFYSLAEARIVIESWRRHYNTERPHGSLGYKPPAPEVFIPALAARAASQPRPAPPPALSIAN